MYLSVGYHDSAHSWSAYAHTPLYSQEGQPVAVQRREPGGVDDGWGGREEIALSQ